MIRLIFLCLFLIGCENSQQLDANLNLDNQNNIAKKVFSYKLGKIDGIGKKRLAKHLIHQFAESGENILDISYKINQSPIMISVEEQSMFDNLTVFIKINYKGIEKSSMVNYQYFGIEKWEYDEGLYSAIANKIFQMIWLIKHKDNANEFK
jgi:hypothetical protein